jgi:hypothetical protein
MFKTITVTIVTLSLIALFGCSAMMDAVTPTFIEPEAAAYADANSTSFMPFTTLWDAERVISKMDYSHQLNQLLLLRQAEDDDIRYGFLKDAQVGHNVSAKQLQTALLTPEGPIGLLLPTLLGGTLGALIIKRPGDVKKLS